MSNILFFVAKWLWSSFLLSSTVQLARPEQTQNRIEPPDELYWPLHDRGDRFDPAGILDKAICGICPEKQDHRIQCIISVHEEDRRYNKPHVSQGLLAKLYLFSTICKICLILILMVLKLQKAIFHGLTTAWPSCLWLRHWGCIHGRDQCSLVAIKGSDTFHDLKPNVDKEGVCNLVYNVWQDKVESLTQLRSICINDFFVPKLVDRESQKRQHGDIHDPSHQFSNLSIVI